MTKPKSKPKYDGTEDAAHILEHVMFRQNYQSTARDELARALEDIVQKNLKRK